MKGGAYGGLLLQRWLRLRRRLLLSGLSGRGRGTAPPPRPVSDVEADVQDVAVLDDIGLAFESLLAVARGVGVRAGGDEVVPADHLATDEAPRNVGVDRARRVERRAAAAERPRARLLLARGEERHEIERLEEPPRDLADRRGATVAERRGLLLRKLRKLGLELSVDASGPVLDREQRLRRKRLELRRQLAP